MEIKSTFYKISQRDVRLSLSEDAGEERFHFSPLLIYTVL